MATFCIASVVVYFVAFMTLQGWRLGIIEAVCVQVIVGLSVDYISHVAVAYVSTREKFMTRESAPWRRCAPSAAPSPPDGFPASPPPRVSSDAPFSSSQFAAFVTVTLTEFRAAVFVLPLALARSVPPLSATGRSRRRFAVIYESRITDESSRHVASNVARRSASSPKK